MLYVPYIMQSIAPDLHLSIGILCTGNESLDNHYQSHMLQNKPYAYFHLNYDARVSNYFFPQKIFTATYSARRAFLCCLVVQA